MANLDRNRAEKLMLEMGVEALILLSPESFIYATGVNAGVATITSSGGVTNADVVALAIALGWL